MVLDNLPFPSQQVPAASPSTLLDPDVLLGLGGYTLTSYKSSRQIKDSFCAILKSNAAVIETLSSLFSLLFPVFLSTQSPDQIGSQLLARFPL